MEALAAYLCSHKIPKSIHHGTLPPSLNYTNTDNGFGLTKDGQGLGLRFGKMLNQSWDIQLGGIAARTKQSGTTYKQNLLSVDAALFAIS